MDKFTKVKKEEGKEVKKKDDSVIFEKDYLKVIDKDGWLYIEESDSVCVVPILIEENKVLLRMEVIPPFHSVDGREHHLTCISGTIEEGEKPEECLVRELEEEAGIVLRDGVVVEIFDVVYKSKTGASRFHLCILPLSVYQYDETIAKGDGSKLEALSKTVGVSVKNINNLAPSDTVTKLLIEEAKKYLNLS
jgi:8-oxo-dGTP pyrophosphatase MutT (NUDIX family)